MAKKQKGRGDYEGCVYFSKSRKAWVATITLGYNTESGRRKRPVKTAKTKHEALEKLKELQEKADHHIHIDADKITVSQWLHKWLDVYKRPKLRENTLHSYIGIVDTCCKYLGDVKLEKLQSSDLQYIIYNVIGSNHFRSCQLFRTVIRQAFARAVKDKLIKDSPAEDLELPPKPPKKKFYKPKTEDWRALLEHRPPFYGWKIAILTELVTGIRRSELLGLTWDAIKVHKNDNVILGGTLEIRGALIYGLLDEETGRRHIYLDTTKNVSSYRTLYIPPAYCQELLAYKREQNKRILAAKSWEHPEMVFTTVDGRYLNPSVFTNYYRETCQDLGIKTTFHMLRHDMATSMKSSHQFDFKDIQSQLGHSTIQITLDTYTHIEEADTERVNNWLDERMSQIL